MTGEIDPLLSQLRDRRSAPRARRFGQGLLLPARAAKFLVFNPSLWPWAILPAILNLVIFAIVATALIFNASTLLEWVWAQPELASWYDWLLRAVWYVVFAILIVGSLIISYYLVLLVGGAVASPFNDKLSEKAERILDPDLQEAGTDESPVADILRSLAVSIGLLMLYLIGLAVLLPLHLVPGLGNLAFTASAACWSAAFLVLDYTEDTLDRRGFSIGEKFGGLRGDLELAAGFGAGTSLLMIVPVLNLLAMPVAVVAGSALGLAVPDPEKSPEPEGG